MFCTKVAVCLACAEVGTSRAIDEGASPTVDAAGVPRSAREEACSMEIRPEGPAVWPWASAATPANAAGIHGLDVAFAEPGTLPASREEVGA